MLKKLTKVLSLLLILCMMVSMFPVVALADEGAVEPTVTETPKETTPVVTPVPEESPVPSETPTVEESPAPSETPADSTPVEDAPAADGSADFALPKDSAADEEEEKELTPEDIYALIPALYTGDSSGDAFYKIVHIDCGRKYFSPGNIKKIIDNAAAAGFNQVELYLSDNQGFRFALDDMNVTTSTGNTYNLTPALGDGYSDGSKYPDGSGEYLTQSEMTDIISHAAKRGIDIVPCINVPGHMGAILEEFSRFKYSGSNSSIDLENAEAVAFALAITEKYATYFQGQGVKYYNLGADEYANDLPTMGFQGLYTSGKYQKFVDFLNSAAQIVINHGMTPRAFNDGIYYNEKNTYPIKSAIQVCYWSCGWSGYNLASAQYLVNQGMDVINTHGDYYWVLGNTGWQCSADKASQFDYTSFQYRSDTTGNSTISDPAGAMFCIWCDVGNANGTDGGTAVVSATADVIAAFGAALPTSETGDGDSGETGGETGGDTDPEPGEPVEVTENKTITVTVGQTATDTIEGADYSNNIVETGLDKSIATVSAEYEQVTGGTEEEQATSITSGSSYYIKDSSDRYLSSSAAWVSDINSAAMWTATSSGRSYTLKNGDNYLLYWYGSPSTTTNSRNATAWTFDNGTFSYTQYSWGGSTTYTLGDAYTVTTTAPVNATTVTFTGVTVGTTYVTVGNTRYTINVVAEDLSKVTPLTVEYWITNQRVTANNATSMTIEASTDGVYSESGVDISTLVPPSGTQGSNTMVFWKGTRLASDNKQTTGGGVDKTKSGTDFVYIRYWNQSWAYSVDGLTWTNVASGDQIVAYYLQQTQVTEEITTLVSDYGNVPGYASSLSPFVMVDYAVKYESGELTPSSFSTAKTIAFHCNYNSPADLGNTVIQDGDTYYRKLGTIKAVETADYEVYMITLTPTSDTKTDTVATNATGAKSYTYGGTEKVIWVDDEANLGDFADESLHYTSPSGSIKYTVGGEPNIAGLEIYKNQCMLVTYYVRAKVTEDSLAVHYVDKTANQEFYSYNIAVKSGTLFNENIGLADPWKGNLANGSVTNLQDKTQTVSADLSTMPAIGAQYRYSEYTCVQVVRSDDGKGVYLYYTFNNAHSFVVDFGLPLTITTADLGISGNWTSASVSGAQYGSAVATVGEGVTYTPTQTLKGVETLQLTLPDSTGSVTHQIYIYPATTVYYEEGFATYTEAWTSTGSKGSNAQKTEIAGHKINNYGYDSIYNTVGASSNSQAISAGADNAEFVFTGTGLDIYANCTTGSGAVNVLITNSAGAIVKMLQVNTATGVGGTVATAGQDVTSYSLPIASVTGLAHDTYTVSIRHIKSSTESGYAYNKICLDGFRVYGTLADQNNSVYVSDLEDNPTYIELRDQVLSGLSVTSAGSGQVNAALPTDTTVAVVASSDKYTKDNVNDLLTNGPKNEIFLQPNQALVLKITTAREVQIGLKALNAATTYTITGKDVAQTLNTSTDMFYTVQNKGTSGEQTITITNTGSGILSITKLKICDDPGAALGELTEEDLIPALVSLGIELEPEEPVVEYADATLTVEVNGQTTTLTKNGVVGESATFTAAEIEAAAQSLVPDGYALKDQAADVTVAYGESSTVSLSAEAIPTEPEQPEEPEKPDQPTEPEKPAQPEKPVNIISAVIRLIDRIFGSLKGFFR